MVKAIMHGCNGHMGRVITDIIKNTEGIELVAGIDKYTKVPNEYPVFENIGACDVEADVIIDFSNAAAADELLGYCVEKQVPVQQDFQKSSLQRWKNLQRKLQF